MGLMEQMIAAVFQQVSGVAVQAPFRRLSYADAMEKYGSGGCEAVRVVVCDQGSGAMGCSRRRRGAGMQRYWRERLVCAGNSCLVGTGWWESTGSGEGVLPAGIYWW